MVLALAGAAAWWDGWPEALRLPVDLARWASLMLAPGVALYLALQRRAPRASELALAALVLSPVVTAVMGIGGIAAGVAPHALARGAGVLFVLGTAVAAVSLRAPLAFPQRRPLAALAALTLALLVLTAYLPLTREWWRIRSDAWFHAAVVSQIADFGLPPEDPYFAGLPLQYMWFYHVLVLVLARGLSADPFRVMALLNVQALAALSLSAYQLAGVFRARFAHRFAATALLLLGFNAAFWVFLPVKLLKVVRGDVRGLDELKRTYSLVPFDYERACGFMNIYFNQEFFLDKFMVATAFGMSLALMTAAWYGAAGYLRTRCRFTLLMLAGSVVGMLGFHSLVGFVTLVGIYGGVLLMWLAHRRVDAFRRRDAVVVLVVSLAAFIATAPYLYEVMHLKQREQVFPISVSIPKTVGIFVSCAFALVLALRARRFLREPAPASRFFVMGGVSVAAFCLLITLPGPNTFDKLGYLVFIPLAIPGGFALADAWLARAAKARRMLLAWSLAFFLPVNVIAFAGCFTTPDALEVTPEEARLSTWIRAQTPRDALMLDDHDRVPFLVTGPRRYYWGCWAYAQQWGYPREEMSRRLHARRALYSPEPIDATALEVLGAVREPLFAVVRPEHRSAGAAVTRRPDLFVVVHRDDDYAIVRVDTAACRAAAARQTDRVSAEELIRESGL